MSPELGLDVKTNKSNTSNGLSGTLEGYSCPRCKKNFGYVWKDVEGVMFFCGESDCLKDDSRASKRREFQENQQKPKKAAEAIGIDARYRDASLSKTRLPQDAQKEVLKWLQGDMTNSLVYIGPPGIGKTYLCAAIANYLSDKGRCARYVNPRRFYEALQAAIQKNQNQYEEIRKFAKEDILIFDDLGSTSCTEWQIEVTFDLIDQRYSQNLPTIITSNLNFDEIGNVFGERFLRRIENKQNTIIEQFVED